MIRSIVAATSVALVAVAVACAGTNPAVLAADNVAIDLTDTVCEPLENQTIGQPFVDMICTLVEGGELIVSELEADAGTGTSADAGAKLIAKTRSIRVRVPATEAATFMAAHRKGMAAAKDGGK